MGWGYGIAGLCLLAGLTAWDNKREREEEELAEQEAASERQQNNVPHAFEPTQQQPVLSEDEKKRRIRMSKTYLHQPDYKYFSERSLWPQYIDYCTKKRDTDEFRESFLSWYKMWGHKKPHNDPINIDRDFPTYFRVSNNKIKNAWRALL